MRYFLLLCMLGLAACTQPASTENPGNGNATETPRELAEVRDYRLLEQVIPGAPDVIELFYYGCRACYYLTDELDEWSREKNISLSLVPAHTQQNLIEGARLFHTLGVLGRLDLHRDAYILFQEPSELDGKDRINGFLDEQGIAQQSFWSAWEGDAVNQRLMGSYNLTALAGVQSTPAFIVQGKYVVEIGVIEEGTGLLSRLEQLVKLQE